MNLIEKTIFGLKVFWHSLFLGLRSADATMQQQTNGDGGEEINQKVKPGGVFADMLEQKVTQEVEELRDKHYRVYREANKFDRGTLSLTEKVIINESGQPETVLEFKGNVKRKRKEDFMQHPPVFNHEGYNLRVIQDVKQYGKSSQIDTIYIPEGLYDFDTNINIERDYIPRFAIEKFSKKIVVWNDEDNKRAIVDIYTPSDASQFGKIDAILISNLHKIRNEGIMKSDITDIDEISWVTEHAWNSEDMFEFKYDDIEFKSIALYDGSFVLSFDCNIVEDGFDLTAKYKTKELDEKYKYEAPKGDGIDIFAADRRAKRDNKLDMDDMSPATFKLN